MCQMCLRLVRKDRDYACGTWLQKVLTTKSHMRNKCENFSIYIIFKFWSYNLINYSDHIPLVWHLKATHSDDRYTCFFFYLPAVFITGFTYANNSQIPIPIKKHIHAYILMRTCTCPHKHIQGLAVYHKQEMYVNARWLIDDDWWLMINGWWSMDDNNMYHQEKREYSRCILCICVYVYI